MQHFGSSIGIVPHSGLSRRRCKVCGKIYLTAYSEFFLILEFHTFIAVSIELYTFPNSRSEFVSLKTCSTNFFSPTFSMNCPVNGSDFIFSISCAIHRDFLVPMLRFLQSLSEVGSSILMFSSGVFSIFGSSTLSEISTVLLRTITTSVPSLALAVKTFSF